MSLKTEKKRFVILRDGKIVNTLPTGNFATASKIWGFYTAYTKRR